MADQERPQVGAVARANSEPDAPRAGLADPVSPDELARMDAWYRRVIGPEAAAEMDRTIDKIPDAAIRMEIDEMMRKNARENARERMEENARENARERREHAINVEIPRMLVRAWADPHAALR